LNEAIPWGTIGGMDDKVIYWIGGAGIAISLTVALMLILMAF
jgi:hypothetical protein